MSESPDDFWIFAGAEQRFAGFPEPFVFIREQLELLLGDEDPSLAIVAIRCLPPEVGGEPKWLTRDRPNRDDPRKRIVTHFATCFQCIIEVDSDSDSDYFDEEIPATVTLCCAYVDDPERMGAQVQLDSFDDADAAYEDDALARRFAEFCQAAAAS